MGPIMDQDLLIALRIAHWGAILRWALLSPSVIRIAHPNYMFFYELFVLDMGPG